MEETKKKEKLRTGFTTGSAAVAAAVAAMKALYQREVHSYVTIWSPSGRLNIPIYSLLYGDDMAETMVIKDGGDDPDCTHGIAIVAKVVKGKSVSVDKNNELNLSSLFKCYTAEGIGVVTSKGLPVGVGEPAVNPVPRKMLKENIEEIIKTLQIKDFPTIILSVPEGKEVAKNTLNERLGIVGGISLLGTTGIVKPISMEAYTATIDLALNRAKVLGIKEVVLSFGRTSEQAAMAIFRKPQEAFIIMGDFFKYAIDKAKSMGFDIILSAQLAKMLKVALEVDNTNVKYGVFTPSQIEELLIKFDLEKKYIKLLCKAKTARHILEIVEKENITPLWERLVKYVAEKYNMKVYLFSYNGELLASA